MASHFDEQGLIVYKSGSAGAGNGWPHSALRYH